MTIGFSSVLSLLASHLELGWFVKGPFRKDVSWGDPMYPEGVGNSLDKQLPGF